MIFLYVFVGNGVEEESIPEDVDVLEGGVGWVGEGNPELQVKGLIFGDGWTHNK